MAFTDDVVATLNGCICGYAALTPDIHAVYGENAFWTFQYKRLDFATKAVDGLRACFTLDVMNQLNVKECRVEILGLHIEDLVPEFLLRDPTPTPP